MPTPVVRAPGARRKPLVGRPRPLSPWRAGLRRALPLGGPSLVLLVLVVVGLRLDWLAAIEAAARVRLIDASAAAGLVVREIRGEGRAAIASDDLVSRLGVRPGDAMLGLDPDAIRARLEKHGRIAAAEVRRLWPDVLSVRVVERRPVAVWRHDGRHRLIDGAGLPFEEARGPRPTGLILLTGAAAPTRARSLLALLATEPDLMGRVRAATLVGDRRWDLLMDEDVVVRLPEIAPAEAWARLGRHQRRSALLDRAVIAVDLRYADRMILRLDPVLAPAGADRGA